MSSKTHARPTDSERQEAATIARALYSKHGSWRKAGDAIHLSGTTLREVQKRQENVTQKTARQVIDLGKKDLRNGDKDRDHDPLRSVWDSLIEVRSMQKEVIDELQRVCDEVAHPLVRPGIEEMIEKAQTLCDMMECE